MARKTPPSAKPSDEIAKVSPRQRPAGVRKPIRTRAEMGVSGTAIHGGYVQTIEQHPKLARGTRYRTAADMLANIGIISAGMRFFQNLLAKPTWTFSPAVDQDGETSDEAKELAEFAEDVLTGMTDNWARIIRRSGLYRYHGFGIHEWTAQRRQDGRVGFMALESRPSYTIIKWDVDDAGAILGVWQRSPQTGQELYIPRGKFMYLVDDAFTDSPEGMGLFRTAVEHADRLKLYQEMEGQGFERDMRGVPVGKAPIDELNQMVEAEEITAEQRDESLAGIKSIIQAKTRKPSTGFLHDSKTYVAEGDSGDQISSVEKWGIELLTGESPDFENIARAIERIRFDLAIQFGVEVLLLGSTESGSRALAKDKSRNLFLSVNAALVDLAEAVQRDLLKPLWILNGFTEDLMPTATPEDITFRDILDEAEVVRSLALSGAVLETGDPIVDWFRDKLGAPRPPEIEEGTGFDDMAPPGDGDPPTDAGPPEPVEEEEDVEKMAQQLHFHFPEHKPGDVYVSVPKRLTKERVQVTKHDKSGRIAEFVKVTEEAGE